MPRFFIACPRPETTKLIAVLVHRAKLAYFASLWGMPWLQDIVSIEFSRAMRRSLGRCVPKRDLVRLNLSALLQNPTLFDEALCHELAYIAVFELHGSEVRPHAS